MTLKQIESALNKGLLTDDEANRLISKVIESKETDDDWYYAKQAQEEKEYNCADADVEDVDFSDIEI